MAACRMVVSIRGIIVCKEVGKYVAVEKTTHCPMDPAASGSALPGATAVFGCRAGVAFPS